MARSAVGRRVVRTLVLVLLVTAGLRLENGADPGSAGAASGSVSGEQVELLAFEDEFLDLAWTDTARTTAAVDTRPPGVVRLPEETVPGGVALHPGFREIAVADGQGVRRYMFDGWGMVERQERLALVGAMDVAYSADGLRLFVAAASGVHVYGFGPGGALEQLAVLDVAGVRAVEAAASRGLWAVTPTRVRYFGRGVGGNYEEIPGAGIAVSDGRDAGFCETRNSLAVLDGPKVRYFAAEEGGRFGELPAFGAEVGEASAVVQGAFGYKILVGDAVCAYTLSGDGGGAERSPVLDDVLPEAGCGLAASPWGFDDHVVVTPWGIRYRAWDGGGYREHGGWSVPGAFVGGGGYRPRAVFVSRVLESAVPATLVRVDTGASTPAGTRLEFEVSTDGGGVWTAVELGESCPVPAGRDVVYRFYLYSVDPRLTPEVDFVRVAGVVLRARHVGETRPGRVRLVK